MDWIFGRPRMNAVQASSVRLSSAAGSVIVLENASSTCSRSAEMMSPSKNSTYVCAVTCETAVPPK